MNDSNAWKYEGLLPLVNRTKKTRVGFIVPDRTEVFLGSIFTPVNRPMSSKEYESFEAIYEDGWRVD